MAVTGTRRAPLRLLSAPESISAARSNVGEALVAWGLDGLVDSATLLVSEVATNVVLHARTDFEVRVEQRGDRVRVSVSDGSDRSALRRRYGLEAGTGRGLALVETLSAQWGVDPAEAPWSKTVWFELDERVAGEDGLEGALYGEDWLALVDDL
jgi:anti-sigma regulatory factor (Ser/Thr protein kinase)